MRLKYLNKAKFKEVCEDIDTVILPVGAIEAHGDHLPLGTDIFIPEGLVDRIEDSIGDNILFAPPINYGHVWTMNTYAGSIDIPTEVLVDYITEVGKSIAGDTFDNIVLLNGHGGNIPAVTTAAERLADYGLQVVIFNWWQDFSDEILEICDSQGHAGEDESSAVLAVAEEYCDMKLAGVNNNKLIANIKKPDIGQVSYKNALSGDATKASCSKGEKILESISEKIIQIIKKVEKGEILK